MYLWWHHLGLTTPLYLVHAAILCTLARPAPPSTLDVLDFGCCGVACRLFFFDLVLCLSVCVSCPCVCLALGLIEKILARRAAGTWSARVAGKRTYVRTYVTRTMHVPCTSGGKFKIQI